MWHPCDSEVVVTAAQDSSVRFWNINKDKEHKAIVKVKNDKGQAKVTPTAIAIGGDGKYLLIASNDGSLQQWAADGPYNRPTGRISQAHMMGSETSSIEISRDYHTIITRGGDDTLKVWDIRKFNSPVKSFNNLPNKYMETDAKFSPDENIIFTGTSVFKNEGVGNLVFIDRKKLEIVKTLPASPSSVISLLWHEDLNQIIAGCSDGSTHVFFNPEWSKKGALYCVQKAPKKVRVDDYETTRPIQTPNSLEMFKAAPSARRQREKARRDPAKSHKPEVPALGAGSGGRLGSSLTAYIMKDLVQKDKITEDPREALAKYADDAEKNPFWFRAYKDKPKMFDETKDDEQGAK
jgi:WD40 repeat protein